MDVVIRLASPDLAAELTTLQRAAAHTAYAHIFPPDAPPPTFESDLARWQQWLGPARDEGRLAYVAVGADDGRAVGVVLVGPDPDEDGVGHLARFYVHPTCWGQGVGMRLYTMAMRDLTERGWPEATLWVLEANTRARRWYERLGWRQSPRRKATYAPAGIEDVQYRLLLNS